MLSKNIKTQTQKQKLSAELAFASKVWEIQSP